MHTQVDTITVNRQLLQNITDPLSRLQHVYNHCKHFEKYAKLLLDFISGDSMSDCNYVDMIMLGNPGSDVLPYSVGYMANHFGYIYSLA